MEKFTAKESDRINELYANGFKGEITADDISLISRFEYMKAYNDIQASIENEKLKDGAKLRADNTQSMFDQAMENMRELHEIALARLERLEKRERPSIEDAQKSEIKIENRSAVSHDGK